MTSVVALANREWQFAEKVKQKLQSDAAWQEKDDRNHWICPWCEAPVENIDISSTFLLLETAPLQISHHLMHHCEPFRTGGADATGEVHGHGDPEEEAMKENMEAASRDMAHFQVSQRKLFAARSRQQSAALPPPSVQGLDIGAVHEPGSEIAGDFYCFVPLEDERIGIAIGDVAGHGPEATTAMLEARRILDTCADGQRSPGKVLAAVNRELSHWKWPETFVSMAYVVLDTSNRRVTVARAGHAPLLLFRAHAQHTPPIVQVAPPGMILGVIGEGFREKIAETRVALQPKDILLLTSFGIPDCPNLSGERFGMQRTARVLKRYCSAPARDLLKHVCKAARTHAQGREVRDDLTAIAVRVV
jgi:serine phosphatase RsbU (regulator of sigma subunit)